MTAVALSRSDAVAGYERLRRCALGERLDEPGFVLLLRRGLRAWIEARDDQTDAGTAQTAPVAGGASGAGMRDELARLMATMVLGTIREEARS